MEHGTTSTSRVRRTKLVSPSIKHAWVPRPRLVEALRDAVDERLILVDAPVGYGKSTLLAQWLGSEPGDRPFAWLSLDAGDSDPARLLTYLVESIRARVPTFGATLAAALEVDRSDLLDAVVPRFLDELRGLPDRLVIVLDDVHVLRGRSVHEVVAGVVAGLPPTTQLVLATRSDPPFPLARMRASGALAELRAADLRFDEAEAAALLASSGVTLDPDDLSALVEASEGWPAGLYLAALSLRTEPDPSGFVHAFAGTHRHIADYLSEEVLSRLPSARLEFLLQTSILDRMCGPLCDAVLDTEGSQAMLEELERSNLFVVALDGERDWYRYHHLFGQMLQAELARTQPGLAPRLHGRASAWFEAMGRNEEALAHALAARDMDRSGHLIARHWLDLFNAGRLATVRQWLRDLGEPAVAANPAVALTAGWVAALTGEPEAMDRWLRIAEDSSNGEGPLPDGTASFESGGSIVRGLFGYEGLEARRAHLERAIELEPPDSGWRPFVDWGLGHIALLSGDPAAARGLFEQVIAAVPHQAVLTMITLSEMAIAETELGHTDDAMILARRAETIARERGLTEDTRSSGVWLALGTVLVARDELADGRFAMEHALDLRWSSGRLSPWPTLEVLVALAPVRFLLGDRVGSGELVEQARAILASLDDAGDLPRRVDEIERLLHRSRRDVEFGQTLTEREMAILRLLATSSSQREIGSELFLSINTVKSHSRAIYRKLGVSSRDEAVERARDLQLLEPRSNLVATGARGRQL